MSSGSVSYAQEWIGGVEGDLVLLFRIVDIIEDFGFLGAEIMIRI